MPDPAPRLLVFIPMYNCSKQIGRVIARVAEHLRGHAHEVVVIDNGSRDGSREVAQSALATLPMPGLLLRNDDNYNLGGSHKVAFAHALAGGFDWVAVLHGDDQADPVDLLPLINRGELRSGCDALLGSRFSVGSRRQGYSWHRTWGNLVFNAIYSLAAQRILVDLGSGLNAFRVEALREPFWATLADDLTFNNQLLLALVQRRAALRFFPISWREEDQVSNVRLLRQAWRSAGIAWGYFWGRGSYLARQHASRPAQAYTATTIFRHLGIAVAPGCRIIAPPAGSLAAPLRSSSPCVKDAIMSGIQLLPATDHDLRSRRARWWWGIGAGVVLSALCVRLGYGGYPVQTGFPFSASVLLDGGTRILDGQMPYRDFHTPIGFTYLALCAGFLSLAHGLPSALALLSACAGIVVGAWAWFLARARLPAAAAGVVAVTIGLLCASPAYFDFGPLEVSYGGHYSRLAWSLFFLVVLRCCLIPTRPSSALQIRLEDLGTGICIGILAGTKFTFFFASLGVVVAAHWFGMLSRANAVVRITGALLAIVIGLEASGASVSGYVHDCFGVGGTASVSSLLLAYRHDLNLEDLALIVVVGVLAWPLVRTGWQRSLLRPLPTPVALAICVLVLGILLSATDGIENASPCYLLVLLVLAAGAYASRAEEGDDHQREPVPGWAVPLSSAGPAAAVVSSTRPVPVPGYRAALLISVAVFAAFATRLAIPIIKGPYASASQHAVLPNGPWRGLDFMPDVEASQTRGELVPYVAFKPSCVLDNAWFLYLHSGADILRRHVQAHDRVLCMDFINPFPYLLGLPAPRGDHLFWHFERNINVRNAPKPEQLFADADWVMEPKFPIFHDSTSHKYSLYHAWIAGHCRLADEDDMWRCWRIEATSTPTTPVQTTALGSHQ